jgi:hypothetical protein
MQSPVQNIRPKIHVFNLNAAFILANSEQYLKKLTLIQALLVEVHN